MSSQKKSVIKSNRAARRGKEAKRGPATEDDVHVRMFAGHAANIFRVVMPADGSFALTSSRDGTVRRWELQEADGGSFTLCGGKHFFGLAVTADGTQLATSDNKGTIRLIDLPSGRQSREWKGHKEEAGNLIFIANGRELVSAAQDGYLRRWETRTGKLKAECRLPFAFLHGIAASLNGDFIVGAAAGGGLAIWSGQEDERAVILKAEVAGDSPLSMRADGRFVLTGTLDGKVARWNVSEGRRVAIFEGHAGQVNAVAQTPDGRIGASVGDDGSVRLWAVETGQCLAILRGHLGSVNDVAITPDAHRIASVGRDGTLRVWDIPETILARAASTQKRGYVNAKVVLLGDSGVGKSGLALRLWHDRWEKTESTHGMEIQRLVLPSKTGDDANVEREVWLWDLAGQPDYRLTHQLFMEQTSLALLVFDPQDDRVFDTLGYWQRALHKVARANQITCILVAARCDRPGLRLTLEEITEWATERGLHGPVVTSAKLSTHSGVAALRDLIASLLPWDKMEFRSTMDNFPALKDVILSVRDAKGPGGVVVRPDELEKRVRAAAPHLTFAAEDLYAVTGLLAGEGVLHALPYGDLVVLQPSWVNCYASTLVKLAGEVDNKLGHVPLTMIQPGRLPDDGTPRLSRDDERQLLPALVTLFLERALAWKQDTDKGPMLVFPSYVRLPRPEAPHRPGRTVLYRFAGPLEEIYCTLVVRLHYSGLFAKTKLYRRAVDFQTATDRLAALTMSDASAERGELEIHFGVGLAPDVQASFQRFIHDHLQSKANGLERLRNFLCPKCKEEVTDRKALDAALSKKRPRIVCAYCDPDDEAPGMIELNDVLERQFVEEGEEGADRAGRKASERITTASMEGAMVGEVQTIVFGANQIYRIVAEPDEGVDGEIEFRNAKHRATGMTYRVQLKSGDSHLRRLSDGTEKFPMKRHYEALWEDKPASPPVLLIIRTSDGRTRFINATNAIKAAKEAEPGKPVTQLVFKGEDFTKEAVLRLREYRLGAM